MVEAKWLNTICNYYWMVVWSTLNFKKLIWLPFNLKVSKNFHFSRFSDCLMNRIAFSFHEPTPFIMKIKEGEIRVIFCMYSSIFICFNAKCFIGTMSLSMHYNNPFVWEISKHVSAFSIKINILFISIRSLAIFMDGI